VGRFVGTKIAAQARLHDTAKKMPAHDAIAYS